VQKAGKGNEQAGCESRPENYKPVKKAQNSSEKHELKQQSISLLSLAEGRGVL
jgi:hypothetical protein